MQETDDLMRPAEVARAFGVDTHTVRRWARQGHLVAFRTLGGDARFKRGDVERALAKANNEP